MKKRLLAVIATMLSTCAGAHSITSDTLSAAYKAMLNVQDTALVLPESMDEGLDNDGDSARWYAWTERQLIHVDQNCVSGPDVEVPESIYVMRMRALPTIIEMPYNQPVKKMLDLYVHRRRAMVERMAGVGYNYYFPIFEDALQRHGLPSELKFLACIESGLRQNAYSRARAAGLWQLVPSTAVMFGLEINSLEDERYDLYKSTDAACRLLKYLYDTYQDWSLAIAAYNCGPGNVNKAMRRSGGKTTFWEIYNYLPAETRSYVPIFIAATYVMTYHCEHNMCATLGDLPPVCDTLMVNSLVHFEQISKVLGIPVEMIESLNPQYIRDIVPGSPEKAKSLMLPSELTLSFIDLQDSILAYKADSLLPHNGDLKEVAAKGKANSYVRSGGNNLGGKNGTAGVANGKGIYVVKKGDNLGAIARKNNTTVEKIKRLNNMRSDKIFIGQKLRVR